MVQGERHLLFYRTVLEKGYKNLSLFGYIADNENNNISSYMGNKDSIRKVIEENDVKIIILADETISRDEIKDIVIIATHHNIRVKIFPEFSNFMPSKNAVLSIESNYLLELTALDTCEIMGVNISVTNMEKIVNKIKDNLKEWNGKCICVSNVHTTVTASEDNSYKTMRNKAVIALPDGDPLSKFSREQGHEDASRVTGPDLMQRILKESTENGWKHYFYGSTQETLDKHKSVINKRYEGTIICGMMSPPFRPLTVAEDEQIIKEINEADPDFI